MEYSDQQNYLINIKYMHSNISNQNKCDYCGLLNSRYHCGFYCNLMLIENYQALANRGFVRSG